MKGYRKIIIEVKEENLSDALKKVHEIKGTSYPFFISIGKVK